MFLIELDLDRLSTLIYLVLLLLLSRLKLSAESLGTVRMF
jgi:hypothetical protein